MPTEHVTKWEFRNNNGNCYGYTLGDEAHVCSLYVKPQARGQGVGAEFIRELQKKHRRITLYPVAEENRQDDLERFYRNLGFKPDFFDEDGWAWDSDDKSCPIAGRSAPRRDERQRQPSRR